MTSTERSNDRKVDEMMEDTFPASDSPSTTPSGGTRKSKEIAEAHERSPHDDKAGEIAPTALPHSDRHASETASARQHGIHPAETDDRGPRKD